MADLDISKIFDRVKRHYFLSSFPLCFYPLFAYLCSFLSYHSTSALDDEGTFSTFHANYGFPIGSPLFPT